MSGNYQTLSTFVSGLGLQETLTGNQEISVLCYHTKVYSTDNECNMELKAGVQRGQMKKISFVHKGQDGASVNINCNCLKYGNTRIVMSKKGDQVELMWLGGIWAVMSTLNYENFMSPTPVVTGV